MEGPTWCYRELSSLIEPASYNSVCALEVFASLPLMNEALLRKFLENW